MALYGLRQHRKCVHSIGRIRILIGDSQLSGWSWEGNIGTRMKPFLSICHVAILCCSVVLTPTAQAQNLDVSAHVKVTKGRGASHASQRSSGDVVVWLTPTREGEDLARPREEKNYTLAQKDKQFIPHVLVVRTGSSVDFPNLDPFYHNVFSLFNGKRFDLGLYEAHTHRAVRFDRDGVSYIFCNIHPEMGAVVVSLSTPYFGVSTPEGDVTIHGVPAGSYRLNVWAENVSVDRLNTLSRVVEISPADTQLGNFELQASGDIMTHHQNKFGENYKPDPKDRY
jgi:plastocyanin